jgi:hypothetical protein
MIYGIFKSGCKHYKTETWLKVALNTMTINPSPLYIFWVPKVEYIGHIYRSPNTLQALYWEHLSWAGFQLTTVMGIGTDCIVSCKSNYHSITTAPKLCNIVSIKQKYTIYNVHAKKLENKSFIFDYLLLILSPCSNVLLFLTHNAYMFLTEFYCTKKKHSFSSWWMYTVSSTNKTEIFLKVAVNTIKLKHG